MGKHQQSFMWEKKNQNSSRLLHCPPFQLPSMVCYLHPDIFMNSWSTSLYDSELCPELCLYLAIPPPEALSRGKHLYVEQYIHCYVAGDRALSTVAAGQLDALLSIQNWEAQTLLVVVTKAGWDQTENNLSLSVATKL